MKGGVNLRRKTKRKKQIEGKKDNNEKRRIRQGEAKINVIIPCLIKSFLTSMPHLR